MYQSRVSIETYLSSKNILDIMVEDKKSAIKKPVESSISTVEEKRYKEHSRDIRGDSMVISAPLEKEPAQIPGRPLKKEEPK
jgi:hypothetical protein